MIKNLELLVRLWDAPSSKRANWTPERRAAQADRCRQIQPWRRSTGPKTELGKARSSLNSRTRSDKRDAQNFNILSSLIAEVERLDQENFQLKAKIQCYEVSSEVSP
jgi:hypothetical protein